MENNAFGGRVTPMFFEDQSSPVILCVHHNHRFNRLNPSHWITKQVLPEGFPAHPHAGFETITIVKRGGMAHRDSVGNAETYGEGRDGSSQWMRAGKGIIHEEMWCHGGYTAPNQELYQIWVDSPSSEKSIEPRSECFRPRVEALSRGSGTVSTYDRPWVGGFPISIRLFNLTEGISSVPIEDGHVNAFVYVSHGGVTVTVDGEAPGGGGGTYVGTHSYCKISLKSSSGS